MPIQLIESTAVLESGDALRRRATEEGYCLLGGFSAADTLTMRAEILKVIGWPRCLRHGQREQGGLLDREAFAEVPGSGSAPTSA